MENYDAIRNAARIEFDIESLKAHRLTCDADMDAHGKWILNTDNRLGNMERDAARMQGWQQGVEQSVRKLQNFQLQLVTGGLVVGALFGFTIRLIWK